MLRRLLTLGDLIREIVVVDDGSEDRTADVAEAVAAEDGRIRVFRQEKNQGKTAAIRRAIAEAVGDVLIVQDADLEYDPAEIPHVVSPIISGFADVVYGSRFLVRRAARVHYFHHFVANKTLTFLSNLLTNRNMSDIETCYKAFRACVIKPLKLTSKGFGMEVEITAMVCKTDARTYEVPISYYGRTYEEGKKIGWSDGFKALGYIFRYNLFSPWMPSRRRYRHDVNEALAKIHASLPADAEAAWPEPPEGSSGAEGRRADPGL